MPNPRLLAIVTVLTCLGAGSTAFASYSLEQLREIERLITSKDCGALRGYIATNPSLLQGADPLADELRIFASGVDTGLIDCLSASVNTVRGDVGFTTDRSY
jgi:hypothetical protein